MEAEQIRILSLAGVGVETYDKHSTWDDPYTNIRKKNTVFEFFGVIQ